MLSKAAKNDIVKRFSEVFKANPSVMLVEYKGLTVAELEGLRSNLKDADTEFKIVKNKLLKIAAKDTEIEQLNDLLVGPTAIAVCESDPTAAAKVFVKTAKDLPLLVIKGGVVEGNVVGVDEITAISKLPSRLEMMAQLLGALSSPMSNLLGALTQMQSKLLYDLEALKDTKEETPVEAKEEAPVESKEEVKAESKEEDEAESKEES
ncbi:MAG: 50S ribosomal protein L10 [Thermodesulfobacteriota bacterium]